MTPTDLEAVLLAPPASRPGEPVWGIATLFPLQGEWTEEEYLALDTNRLVELSDGCLQFLPMPLPYHQLIVKLLYDLLNAFVNAHASGKVLFAPLRIRLWQGTMREPDLVYLRPEQLRNLKKPPDGADLVMEVVSGSADDRERNLVTKRKEYARAGISEYWIVDPDERKITVLTLGKKKTYRVHGAFVEGSKATSLLLPGFAVDVAAIFAAGEGKVKG
ncbi:MAG TPA: Uma2 family endonuclease [Gemmataceae bacterium]|jgi:Uma2 family endonuclease